MTSEVNGLLLANAEVSEFIARTAAAGDELALHDATRRRAFVSSQYRQADNFYFQYQIGTLNRRQMESPLYPLVLNFQRRGRLRTEWEAGADKSLSRPDLVAYLDHEISKPDQQ